ncbi:MAG: hypothetical protein MUF18_12275 [Fimbriiglobus sp.]|jgi:hypothetical protein|nr:hypothetical protein [Fimbriiglobus sp.]
MDELTEPTAEETRQVLRRVAEYRKVCDHVRGRGLHTLVFGLMMLVFWYFFYYQGLVGQRWGLFSLLALGLAVLEIGVGLLQRFFPSAEGLLLDGIVMLAFAASNGVRAFLLWQMTKKVDYVFIGFGVLWTLQGLNLVRSYATLVKQMPARPTREHLRWFNGLLADLRDADPKADPRALAIPTDPYLTGLMLGDNAFFLDPLGEVLITTRRDVTLEFENSPDPAKLPRGYLSIDGHNFPPFKLNRANWDNYVAWKREGGEDPMSEQ